MAHTIHHGNCLDVLRGMPDNSVDSIVTDPPYGLSNTSPDKVADTIVAWASGDREHVPAGKGFMGASWDAFVPPPAVWDECYRVLKPGGHLAVFAGSRTQDLMGLSIRLAGFDLRDSLAWLYGSGFPKSLDVGKAIDKARDEDAEPRRKVAAALREALKASGKTRKEIDLHFGTTNVSQYWFSTERNTQTPPADKWPWLRDFLGLGPELDAEVWRLNGRKGTAGDNWGKREVIAQGKSGKTYGMGGLRGVETSTGDFDVTEAATSAAKQWSGWGTSLKPGHEPILLARKPLQGTVAANVQEWGTGALNIDATRIGTQERPLVVSDRRSGNQVYGDMLQGSKSAGSTTQGRFPANVILDEHQASALDMQAEDTAKFFYCAKAGKRERPNVDGVQHPTVKPVSLMSWLVKLLTPPGGTVLDPFAGSGTTIEAAILEGFHPIGIEAHAPYIPLIQQRIDRATDTLPMAS